MYILRHFLACSSNRPEETNITGRHSPNRPKKKGGVTEQTLRGCLSSNLTNEEWMGKKVPRRGLLTVRWCFSLDPQALVIAAVMSGAPSKLNWVLIHVTDERGKKRRARKTTNQCQIRGLPAFLLLLLVLRSHRYSTYSTSIIAWTELSSLETLLEEAATPGSRERDCRRSGRRFP